ncbi:MAG: hydrogenase nickel incorporation protein HypB [Ignavibacteria bacterium]|jgi:hydrogenase nickel incorporation protein HypB
MCDTCGCSGNGDSYTVVKPGEEIKDHDHSHNNNHHHLHDHEHNHDHPHSHSHDHSHSKKIEVQSDILLKNNLLAERNRGYFQAKNIKAVNLVSSPGSGKTSLLEQTITDLKGKLDFYVIEGDQQTLKDAQRIEDSGAPAVQINTGSGCHLDAEMINKAVLKLQPKDNSIMMIENVGNLVCPSLFDLGEDKRVVIMSTAEGDDKPVKYPNMFQTSHLCIINKIDLLPYLDFDLGKAKDYALKVNRHLEFIELSVKTKEGLDNWYKWLEEM